MLGGLIHPNDPTYYLKREGGLPFYWSKIGGNTNQVNGSNHDEIIKDSIISNDLTNSLINKDTMEDNIILSKETEISSYQDGSIETEIQKTVMNISENRTKMDIIHSTDQKRDNIPYLPFIEGKHSLEYDMIFGWIPHIEHGSPIPLKFKNQWTDMIIANILANKPYSRTLINNHNNINDSTNNNNPGPNASYSSFNLQATESLASTKLAELIYLGFQPIDSFQVHKTYSSPDTYFFKFSSLLFSKYESISKYLKKNYITKRPFKGMNPKLIMTPDHDNLIFDSNFESGNLDAVIQIDQNEYDCYIRIDSNTKGHTNWFYFKIKNTKAKQKIKINIVNFVKFESLYKRGMKPYIFSEKSYQLRNISWMQAGENINYNSYVNQYYDDNNSETRKKRFYILSFYYTFNYDDDIVSFATCVPYTYTDLLKMIKSLSQINIDTGQTLLKKTKLCMSLGGIEIPLLKITEYDDVEIPFNQRQCVIITGRVHPGETNSSWMIHGFLMFILGNSKEAKFLRKRLIFQVIPMLNPDGVIIGNHRTGLCGMDLNRQFMNPNQTLHQNISYVKKLVSHIKNIEKFPILAYIDFHGHLLKKGSFMYGAEYPVHHDNYYRIRIIPKLISKNSEMFRFQSCIFRLSKPKYGTSRGVFSMHYDISNCYTMEASFGSYLTSNRETMNFDEKSFQELGKVIGISFYDYLELLNKEENQKLLRKKQKEQLKIKKNLLTQQGVSPKNHQEPNINIGSSPKYKVSKLPSTPLKFQVFSNEITPSKNMSNKLIIKRGITTPITPDITSKKFDTSPKKNSSPCYIKRDVTVTTPKIIKSAKVEDNISRYRVISARQDLIEKTQDLVGAGGEKLLNESFSKEDENVSMYLNLTKLIREIDQEENYLRTNNNNNNQDTVSEGESDTESEGENFNENDRKRLNQEIVRKIEIFAEFLKNNKKPLIEYIEQKSKKLNKILSNTSIDTFSCQKCRKVDNDILIDQHQKSKIIQDNNNINTVNNMIPIHLEKRRVNKKKKISCQHEINADLAKLNLELMDENIKIKNNHSKRQERGFMTPKNKIRFEKILWKSSIDNIESIEGDRNNPIMSINTIKPHKRNDELSHAQQQFQYQSDSFSRIKYNNSNNGSNSITLSQNTTNNDFDKFSMYYNNPKTQVKSRNQSNPHEPYDGFIRTPFESKIINEDEHQALINSFLTENTQSGKGLMKSLLITSETKDDIIANSIINHNYSYHTKKNELLNKRNSWIKNGMDMMIMSHYTPPNRNSSERNISPEFISHHLSFSSKKVPDGEGRLLSNDQKSSKANIKKEKMFSTQKGYYRKEGYKPLDKVSKIIDESSQYIEQNFQDITDDSIFTQNGNNTSLSRSPTFYNNNFENNPNNNNNTNNNNMPLIVQKKPKNLYTRTISKSEKRGSTSPFDNIPKKAIPRKLDTHTHFNPEDFNRLKRQSRKKLSKKLGSS